jgi:protein SCO1/2
MPDKSQMIRKIMLSTGVLLLLGSLLGLFWLNYKLRQIREQSVSPTLPVLVQLPPFSLTERNRKPMGLEDLMGSVWIADFIFTRCPGPCPLMTSRLAKLQEIFKEEASMRLVSITVDPEYDTSQVLSEYADLFQAKPGRWFFLTGEKSRIHQLAQSGFLVGSVQDVAVHSTRFILVDRKGRVRGYYDSQDDEDILKLIHDTRFLLREAES